MRKFLLLLLVSASSLAQIPQGISYQAIALNGSGNPVVSASVGIRLSLMDNSASGTVIYKETHMKTTNANGLFNLTIGQGTVVTGTFSEINWGTNSKFLKVELDAAGGTNYVAVGTTQLLSVPYAMYAGNTVSIAGNSSINDDIIDNKTANFAFIDYTANRVYAYNANLGSWSFQIYSSDSSPDLQSSNGNFSFTDYTANKVYIYNGKTAVWSSQLYSSDSSPNIALSNGSYAFVDYTQNKVFAYSSKTGSWSNQTYSTDSSPDLSESNGIFAFVDYTANKVYAYNGRTGTWSNQTYSTDSSPSLTMLNGNILFVDYTAHRVYAYNSKSGVWSFQTYSADSSPDIFPSETN